MWNKNEITISKNLLTKLTQLPIGNCIICEFVSTHQYMYLFIYVCTYIQQCFKSGTARDNIPMFLCIALEIPFKIKKNCLVVLILHVIACDSCEPNFKSFRINSCKHGQCPSNIGNRKDIKATQKHIKCAMQIENSKSSIPKFWCSH